MRARERGFAGMPRRSGGERRHGDTGNDAPGAGFETSHHEVSQHGAVCRGDGGRGQRPISTMQPPQMGHRSMRWPVRIA